MESKKTFADYANGDLTTPRLGLERIKILLDLLGNPDSKLRIIHVAGTNGKGSVCRFLTSILSEAGYKAGLFSSPCLTDRCDAISVNGVNITSLELDSIYEEIGILAEKMTELPTPFEISAAAALMYFVRQNCDYCILETGMGGATDATNAISDSVLDIFVPIAADHIAYLGSTLAEIASVKAGIIKKSSAVITAKQQEEVMLILKHRAKNNSFTAAENPIITGTDGIHEIFDCKGLKSIRCGLAGVHQPQNAAVAIEAAYALGTDERSIKCGVENAKNPARFEYFEKDGAKIIFDGAHNPHGMNSFVTSVNRYFGTCPKTVVLAAMHDKEINKMVKELKKINGDVTFYTVGVSQNDRAEKPHVLEKIFMENGLKCRNMKEISCALAAADKKTPVFVCGSLYLYKEFIQYINQP